jgi:hypothetical protein
MNALADGAQVGSRAAQPPSGVRATLDATEHRAMLLVDGGFTIRGLR